MVTKRRGAPEYLVNLAIRTVLGLALLLPYSSRSRFVGWVMAHIAAPLAGWDRRTQDNLALIWPDLPADEVRRLTRRVPNNFGRALIESYSGEASGIAKTRRSPDQVCPPWKRPTLHNAL